MKKMELEITATILSDMAFRLLTSLMSEQGTLEKSIAVEKADIEEAEWALKFKRAVAERTDILVIRIQHD